MAKLYQKLDDDFETHSGELEDYEYARGLYLYEVLYNRPIGYWRFSETSGVTAFDTTSKSLDGALQGTYELSINGALVNEDNGALRLTTDGAVKVPHSEILNLSGSFSIEFFAKINEAPSGAATPGIIWKGDPSDPEGGYAIYYDDSFALTFIRNNNTYSTSVDSLNTSYNHFILTYNSETQTLTWFRNGILLQFWVGVEFPTLTSVDDVYFGRYFTDYVEADLDEIALYNRIITEQEAILHNRAGEGLILSAPLFNAYDGGKHYDVRAFHAMDLTVPTTMNDLKLEHATFWNGKTMLELANQRVVEGRKFRPSSMDDIEVIEGEALESLTILDIERYTVSLGNEEWPVDEDVTVGKVPAWLYANALQIRLRTGRAKSVASYYLEDIDTDFKVADKDYWIEIVLRDFPAQNAYGHLDLANSFIDFSSDDGFAEELTDMIPFSASVNSIVGGGDVYFQFPKTMLVKCSLKDLRRIKFRLQAETVEPPDPPEAEVNGAGDLDEPQSYQVTWVTEHGESVPSDFSDVVEPSSQSVDVTIPLGPEGVIGRKLYRRGGTDNLGTMTYLDSLDPGMETLDDRTIDQIEHYFQNGVGLVATINDNTTTLVNDNETELGDPPPEDDTSTDFTVKLQAMRLYEEDYDFNNEVYVDTKRFQLAQQIPRAGSPEWSTDHPPLIMKLTRPKNLTEYIKFNSGHQPPGGKKNSFTYIFRYDRDTGDSLGVKLDMSGALTRISIVRNGNSIDTQVGAVLSEETDYCLKIDAYDETITATLYRSQGVYLGDQIVTLDTETDYIKRGYTGFWFQPYNYDFVIDYIRNFRAEFAQFESEEFPSIAPVIGATLYPYTSLPINLIEDVEWIDSGEDVTIEQSETLGLPPPAYVIQRTGQSWYGGQESVDRIITGDPEEVLIVGDIYLKDRVRGTYRIVLIDKNESVGFIAPIPNLVANKWNHFEVPITADLVPAGYRFFIHQAGFFNDEFWLDNISLMHQTISWTGKADNSAPWQKFRHAIGRQYSGLQFSTRGTGIKVQATAVSDDAWIQGYELRPIYNYPGQKTAVK